jgi:hypothetical protein
VAAVHACCTKDWAKTPCKNQQSAPTSAASCFTASGGPTISVVPVSMIAVWLPVAVALPPTAAA